MNTPPATRPAFSKAIPLGVIAALLPALALAHLAGIDVERADAAPKRCFGKKVNRVVKADGARVRVGFRDVVWVSGERTTVIGKPYSTICAGDGTQTIRAGKGRSKTDAGPGDDRIVLHPSSNLNRVRGGTGNDSITGSNGHDIVLAGPAVGEGDTDTVDGGGGNDRLRDLGGIGNLLFGQNGSDRITSGGKAVSELHGGNGTDFLYSNGGGSKETVLEKLFGERGNDRLYGDLLPNNGPAFFDPGPGDDWVKGTPADDTAVFNSGIKKIFTNGGNDLVVAASYGRATVDGGSGVDTISFATHTPPGYRKTTGVYVNLADGVSIGASRFALSNFEDVIGSSFDDELHGAPGVENVIEGGLGNDDLVGYEADRDTGDGGIGVNECRGFEVSIDCNDASPGNFDTTGPVVDIDESGVLTVIGSARADTVGVEYDVASQRYTVQTDPAPVAGGLCEQPATGGNEISCPAPRQNLNGLIAYGANGDDAITIGNSVPTSVTTTINGGSGRNVLTGGETKDFISSDTGDSAGTVIDGRGGSDLLYLRDDVKVSGGSGADVLHVVNPCVGGYISGGPDKDNLVFAAATRGIRADFGKAYAEWAVGGCSSGRLSLDHDIENLEGSSYDDFLTLGRKYPTQDGIGGLLGREGIDYLNSRNGKRDNVTTGSGGRKNTVIADRIDRITWGWGLAGY